MEEQINSLKNMIESAKNENDEVLVHHLTQALNHLLEKQKQQEDIKLKSQENINQEENKTIEEKKEVFTETKQEEEKKEEKELKDNNIKKIITGEVSKYVVYKNNYVGLDSKYTDINPHARNKNLRGDLGGLLIDLGLDDVFNRKKATVELYKILDTYQTPADEEDIKVFLDEVSKVGHVGLELKEAMSNYDSSQRKEVLNRYFEDEYDKQKKKADFLDMELEELNNKSVKNSDDYEELIDRYQTIIIDLEKLQDETFNKIDSDKAQKLEATIQHLKSRIAAIRKYLKDMKDISDYAENAFNSINF